MNIILASSSIYRKKLLSQLNIDFTCISADIDEDSYKEKIADHYELVQKLGFEKAKVIQKQNPDALIIGSDQLVSFGNEVLGKAAKHTHAIKQLEKLQGCEHKLLTSYTLLYKDQVITHTNTTLLKMRALTKENIEKYLLEDRPYDCAGTYKLELKGISLFEKIQTDDQTSIIGLPLIQLTTDLLSLGVNIL